MKKHYCVHGESRCSWNRPSCVLLSSYVIPGLALKDRSRIVINYWYVLLYAFYIVYKSMPLTLPLYSVVNLVSDCGKKNHGDWIDTGTCLNQVRVSRPIPHWRYRFTVLLNHMLDVESLICNILDVMDSVRWLVIRCQDNLKYIADSLDRGMNKKRSSMHKVYWWLSCIAWSRRVDSKPLVEGLNNSGDRWSNPGLPRWFRRESYGL
jgi:hypothetical protein